jgi:large subunit ribosomal protein L25
MKQLDLKANSRSRAAKGDNRRLRASGRVPAIIYGGDAAQPQTIDISDHEMEMILHGAYRCTEVINLGVGDATEPTLVRDIQRHPVSSRLVHMDFMRIDLNREVEVEVSVHGLGIPVGVREGGILDHLARTVTVRCTPINIPHSIDVDISELGFNQSLHVSDLKIPEGVRIMDAPDTPIFAVLAPRAVEEKPAEAAVAEPEVIGVKKKEVPGKE